MNSGAYLWVGETTMTPELANAMSWYQAARYGTGGKKRRLGKTGERPWEPAKIHENSRKVDDFMGVHPLFGEM